MTTITSEEIAQYQSELADYPEALAAFDVIEEWERLGWRKGCVWGGCLGGDKRPKG
ncbi:hypothetical protein [Allocoleopsis sp.]|uniref:hypothetical protein n=1 Tax=Allocoleopsis sp. TaxID=3088169 RepID=UPI002FD6D9DA